MAATGVILTAPTARGPDGTSKTTFLHGKNVEGTGLRHSMSVNQFVFVLYRSNLKHFKVQK